MQKETVRVYPTNKTKLAYRYAPTVMLIHNKNVPNTDTAILTDTDGYRYKRLIRSVVKDARISSVYYEFHKI